MKVSVVTTSYNQEAYIAQALDSVLTQQCDFDFEYIVSDDASTDRTPEILAEYQSRYPDRIRLILRDVNVGAQLNLSEALWLSTSEYVALLDGDDYWTSPEKLSKQVAFMDAHPDCALSFHDTMMIYPNGRPSLDRPAVTYPERLEIEDLFRDNFISACTVMYRWGLVDSLPSWWKDVWIGDFPLHVLHAQFGWIGHIDEVMSAYRLHGDGLWSGRLPLERRAGFVDSLERLDETLGRRYHTAIQQSIFKEWFDEAFAQIEAGARTSARKHAHWCLGHLRYRSDVPAKDVVLLALRADLPWAIPVLVNTKALLRGRRGDPRR